MIFYKYQGAGNDFLLADCRGVDWRPAPEEIRALCDRHYGIGADGLMLLSDDPEADFRMEYYNSDGSGGMMCGNGGRCIVAFAADLGYASFRFNAPDGPHEGRILSADGKSRIVSLAMGDVLDYQVLPDGDIYLFTGTRHRVRFVRSVLDAPVAEEGARLRRDPAFAPEGTNVNFVELAGPSSIRVRTFEKGVEAETCACGTGIVASSVAAFLTSGKASGKASGECSGNASGEGFVTYAVRALNDDLEVSFIPEPAPGGRFSFTGVTLTGPATFVARIDTGDFFEPSGWELRNI